MIKKFIFIFLLTIFLLSLLFANNKLKDIADYKIIESRNLFAPIWKPEKVESRVEFRQNDDFSALKKQQEEERLLKQQQEQERSLKLQEEQEKRELENKKKVIEQGYKLNGILHDNGALQAIVVDNKNTTYFVKVNEKLDDLKVLNIDEKKGSIRLSYQDKIEVILYME